MSGAGKGIPTLCDFPSCGGSVVLDAEDNENRCMLCGRTPTQSRAATDALEQHLPPETAEQHRVVETEPVLDKPERHALKTSSGRERRSSQWYNRKRVQITSEIEKHGAGYVKRKYDIGSGTLSGLRKRWGIMAAQKSTAPLDPVSYLTGYRQCVLDISRGRLKLDIGGIKLSGLTNHDR